MRIYDRASFLKLPDGTIFAQGTPYAFDGIRVKGGTLPSGNDFWALEIGDIQCDDSNDRCERMDRMLKDGTSEPMNEAASRGSSYDKDDAFLVFERADLMELMIHIIKAAQVTPT